MLVCIYKDIEANLPHLIARRMRVIIRVSDYIVREVYPARLVFCGAPETGTRQPQDDGGDLTGGRLGRFYLVNARSSELSNGFDCDLIQRLGQAVLADLGRWITAAGKAPAQSGRRASEDNGPVDRQKVGIMALEEQEAFFRMETVDSAPEPSEVHFPCAPPAVIWSQEAMTESDLVEVENVLAQGPENARHRGLSGAGRSREGYPHKSISR